MLDLENRLKTYQEVDFSAFFYEVLKKKMETSIFV